MASIFSKTNGTTRPPTLSRRATAITYHPVDRPARRSCRAANFAAFWYVIGVACGALLASQEGFAQCDDCTSACGGIRCAKTLFSWNACCPEESDGDDVIVTDRPDFTESSSTVGLRRYQFEMGYTYAFDTSGTTAVSTESYPELLVRAGLFADWFELRIGWTVLDEVTRNAPARNRVTGSDDLVLGIKWGLTSQCGILPEMAVITQMTVPSGDDDFSADEVLPGFNWLVSWELTERVGLGASTSLNRTLEPSGNSYSEMAQSIALGVGLTDKLGAYAEWYAFFPHSATDPSIVPLHFFNGGFSWLMNDDVQYDIRAGLGLNDAAEDYFVGTGVSFRF